MKTFWRALTSKCVQVWQRLWKKAFVCTCAWQEKSNREIRLSIKSSCCCWIFHLIYALSTSTTVLPLIFLNILNYHSIYLFIHPSIFHFIYISIHLAVFLSINQPLSLTKYQYIIAADSGAGIGLAVGFFVSKTRATYLYAFLLFFNIFIFSFFYCFLSPYLSIILFYMSNYLCLPTHPYLS